MGGGEKCGRRSNVLLAVDDFGQLKDDKGQVRTVKRFTWTNTNNVSVQLITYGGYITSIKVPDRQGNIEDVVVGFNDLEGYLGPQNRFFGATVGRVANRIGAAKMTIEGVQYTVTANNGPNQLHGGFKGFDKRIWDYYVRGNKVVLSYHSADLEEGHPGDVLANVTFELTKDNEILIDYSVTTTKPTCVNMTNHSYFNLAGNGKGAAGLYDHVVAINADRITENSAGIPTGKILPVAGTVFDFRVPRRLGDVINNVPNAAGYDNNFCIIKGSQQGNAFVAKVDHPPSGRTLEVYSDQPGVQFYTGNALPEDTSSKGKDGYIQKHGAFCLETQIYPDAVNHWWFSWWINMSCARKTSDVQLEIDDFGETIDSSGNTVTIKRFTWTNSNNVSVQLITYGGYITSIKVPDNGGNVEDIVIGFDTLEGYISSSNSYFGATIGRCANRIKKGQMTIEGVTYQLATNDGQNHLHGGIKGFDKVIWEYYVTGTKVVLSYNAQDLEEGYPGDVVANVTFELTSDNELLIDYKATTSKPTVVNLTNHSYFNLAGHDKGAVELYKHVVSINADKITEVDSESIPTGNLPTVSGTVFDLRIPTVLGDVIQKVPDSPGYDHNFCVTRGTEQETAFVAKVTHPDSGRTIEVYSNQPGVQFYTGNYLPEDDSLVGKGGSNYRKHGTICLETQIYPDAINNPQFGKSILYPGELYHHTATLKFSVE